MQRYIIEILIKVFVDLTYDFIVCLECVGCLKLLECLDNEIEHVADFITFGWPRTVAYQRRSGFESWPITAARERVPPPRAADTDSAAVIVKPLCQAVSLFPLEPKFCVFSGR